MKIYTEASHTRILIIGSAGQLGGALYDVLSARKGWRVRGADKIKSKIRTDIALDITNKRAVRRVMSKIRPDIVVLTAAITNVDACESERKRAYEANVGGVQHVAEACKEYLAKLVFFSSAYVFDGVRGHYREEDAPHPINYYGKTKLWGEQFIQKALNDYIIIRTTWVFDWGYDEKNFLAQAVCNLGAGNGMKVPRDQYGNPTLARNISEIVGEMIEHNHKGIWHIAGRERMNKYEWAVRMARHFDLDASLIIPVMTRELLQKAKRPPKGDLDTRKAQKTFQTKLLSLPEALRSIRQ